MSQIATFQARVLVPGAGEGEAMVLPEPLSLWGGLDPETGEIIDRRHPSSGSNVSGRVLLLTIGRGSSSASSILLEAVRNGVAPEAIITCEPDHILALGAAVAREMYAKSLPVVVLDRTDYAQIRNGQHVVVSSNGRVSVGYPSEG
jgi:predicted aconitase with swiveling domain